MATGLEVLGATASIVSAFNARASLYKDWRKQCRHRKERKKSKELQQIMETSGPDIQRQYEIDFRHIGMAFAGGDSIHNDRCSLIYKLIKHYRRLPDCSPAPAYFVVLDVN